MFHNGFGAFLSTQESPKPNFAVITITKQKSVQLKTRPKPSFTRTSEVIQPARAEKSGYPPRR